MSGINWDVPLVFAGVLGTLLLLGIALLHGPAHGRVSANVVAGALQMCEDNGGLQEIRIQGRDYTVACSNGGQFKTPLRSTDK